MNDPRESLDWSFGSVNFPYEEIFKGYYSDKNHIDCQFKYGNKIKDGYQVLCFTGAEKEGWNNEMMWAHYGGLHSGVCLEFDEDMLVENLKKNIQIWTFFLKMSNILIVKSLFFYIGKKIRVTMKIISIYLDIF